MTGRKYSHWIDFLKGIAMLAVLTDHAHFIHGNILLASHCVFSIPMFFLVSGFTMSTSLGNAKTVDSKYVMRRLLRILVPYAIGTICYQIFIDHYVFDLKRSITYLLNFNADDVMYFVLVYIQFVIIAPFVYRIVNRHRSIIYDLFILLVFYLVSILCYERTIMVSVLAGRYLFGATFLTTFCMGFILYKWHPRVEGKLSLNLALLVLSIAIISAMQLNDHSWIRSGLVSPPNKFTLAYFFAVFSLLYSLRNIIVRFNVPAYLMSLTYPIRLIGVMSLYIFIYHKLVYLTILRYEKYFLPLDKSSLFYNEFRVVLYLSLGIILPILIGFAFTRTNRSRLVCSPAESQSG